MSEYKSTYEKIMEKAIKEGRYHVLSEEQNIKIMQELNTPSDDDISMNGIKEGGIFPSEDDVYLR